MIAITEPLDIDALRLRNEFLAMPGLIINTSQVARLLGVRFEHAMDMLDALEREDFLMRTRNGSYRRAYPLSA